MSSSVRNYYFQFSVVLMGYESFAHILSLRNFAILDISGVYTKQISIALMNMGNYRRRHRNRMNVLTFNKI